VKRRPAKSKIKRSRRRSRQQDQLAQADVDSGTTELLRDRLSHPETSPILSGGDIDADWTRAESSGEEAVGGSVTTPDQDVVDELGRALGVEQAPDAEVRTSEELLQTRDRHYWHLERRAVDDDARA
jgi:hypothetical protein